MNNINVKCLILQILMINFMFNKCLITYAERCKCKAKWSNHFCEGQEGCPLHSCDGNSYRWCEAQEKDGCKSNKNDGVRWVKCDDSSNPTKLTYKKFSKHGCNAKDEILSERYDSWANGMCTKRSGVQEWMRASADRCDSSDVKLVGTIYSDDKCRTIKYEKFILSYFPGQSNKCYDLSENISTIWTCHIWGGISPAISRYKFVPILHLLIVLISMIMCVFFQQ